MLITIIAKLILILSLASRTRSHIKQDERYEDKDEKLGARLATATIFAVTLTLYFIVGIFNFTQQC